MENATAAAHIVTANAQGLGGPEVIVMTPDVGMGAKIVKRYMLGGYAELADARIRLATEGWRALGEPVEVEQGYHVVDVEKI